ncbi:MAG: hypothetical protein H7832_14775 [Magnetococcus sp. DMHC-6]
MKAKQFGLVSVAILFVSIFGTGGYLGWFYNNKINTSEENNSFDTTMKQVPQLDTESWKMIQKFSGQMDQLRNPGRISSSVINQNMLEMIGFSVQSLNNESAISNAAKVDYTQRIVSMAYVSGIERYAVIDDKFYQEGDLLEGEADARVRTITQNRVLIAGKEIRQWVNVFNPTGRPVQEKKKEGAPVEKKQDEVISSFPKKANPTTTSDDLGETINALKGYSQMMDAMKNNK